MIFLDSVVVKRNLKYLMSLSTASSVINKKEVKIAGSIRINSQDDVYSSACFTLKDDKGTTIDTFEKTGLTLKKGKRLAFEFAKPLALTIGEATSYSIEVKLDDYTDVVKNSIKSLTFEPVKYVVNCSSCFCFFCFCFILSFYPHISGRPLRNRSLCLQQLLEVVCSTFRYRTA